MPGPTAVTIHTPASPLRLDPNAKLQSDVAEQNLRDALSKAGVSQSAADQIVQQTQQQQQETFYGYVFNVVTSPGLVGVVLMGKGNNYSQDAYQIEFPPNDRTYLPELLRAQSQPHLRVMVHLTLDPDPSKSPIINWMFVLTDYDQPPIPHMPSFDVVEIKSAAAS